MQLCTLVLYEPVGRVIELAYLTVSTDEVELDSESARPDTGAQNFSLLCISFNFLGQSRAASTAIVRHHSAETVTHRTGLES